MGTFPRLAIVAAIHISFVVTAYATGFFGLHLPRQLMLALWLAGSSICALAAYIWVLMKSPLLASESGRVVKLGICAVTTTLVSLYLGIFIAFDTFGS